MVGVVGLAGLALERAQQLVNLRNPGIFWVLEREQRKEPMHDLPPMPMLYQSGVGLQ